MTNDLTIQTNQSIYNPELFMQFQKIADVMANTTLVPECLQKKPADCFMVTQQAHRWKMDPFAVAQCVSVVRGKFCVEGKLVAAVLRSLSGITLSYKYDGVGDNRTCTISGKRQMEVDPVEITITLKNVKTQNDSWIKSPDQMLAYRGARDWARRYEPGAMLGIYTEDEMIDVTPRTSNNNQLAAALEKNKTVKPTITIEDILPTPTKHDEDGVVVEDVGVIDTPNIDGPNSEHIAMAFRAAENVKDLENIMTIYKDYIDNFEDVDKADLRETYKNKLNALKGAR